MTKEKKQSKKEQELQAQNEELQQQYLELEADLQRTRADFENYRRRTEQDIERARETGKSGAILKLLPIIDNIERAIAHQPEHLQDDKWAQGVAGLAKNLEKSLELLGVKRIEATPGTPFNPELHEAVMSEEGENGEPVISEEMQAGYTQNGTVIRHSMVKVRN